MLKKTIGTPFFLILIFSIFSCSSGGMEGGGNDPETDVGTIVTLPTGSSIKFFADFALLFPETSLGSELEELKPVPEPPLGAYSLSKTNPFFLWNRIVLGDNFVLMREYRANLEAFGQLLTDAFSSTTLDQIRSSPVTVTLPAFTLIETSASGWKVEASAEKSDDSFIRLHIVNADSETEMATYTVHLDEAGEPIKCLFAYVRPELITEAVTKTGTRYLALTYDSGNPLGRQMMMRMDRYNEETKRYFVNQIYYDAFVDSSLRVDEFVQIVIPSPLRAIAPTALRLSYDNTGDVCMASMDREANSIISFAFQGPEGPDMNNLNINTCEPATPIRGNVKITADMLPYRYLDTTPYGGDAAILVGDGSSKDSWQTVNPQTIEQWLNPQ